VVNKRISSLYATGGGGIMFEHEIDALYLTALLVEDRAWNHDQETKFII
jgi:hypothetical protein